MKYIKIIIATLILALIGTLFIQHNRITHLKEEKVKYEHNVNVLMGDIESYKTKDSLNVARIESLELNMKEMERFRAEDLRIIEKLRMKNRDLSALTKSYLATITHLLSKFIESFYLSLVAQIYGHVEDHKRFVFHHAF